MSTAARHSVRDINETLRHLSQLHAAGALDLQGYRGQRDRIIDALCTPRAAAALVDDAATEVLPLASAAYPTERQTASPIAQFPGWGVLRVLLALVALVALVALSIVVLVAEARI
jgi:hypothetical protein